MRKMETELTELKAPFSSHSRQIIPGSWLPSRQRREIDPLRSPIGAPCENPGASGTGSMEPIRPKRSSGGGTFGGILGASIFKSLQLNTL